MSLPPGLYGIADAGFGDPVRLGRKLLAGGARVLQLRCKGWPLERVREATRLLAADCARSSVPLLVNDHLDLAGLAQGVHLGQGDGPFDRSVLQPGALVGRSTHDLLQLATAVKEGVDYVGFGPVFQTHTKPGALTARGVDALQAIVEASPVPVVAIGGLTEENLARVQATGVHGWAVISAILRHPDPVAATRRMTEGPPR